MNRRAFLATVPAVALTATPTPTVAKPVPIPPRERIKSAIAEIEAAFREMYPNHNVVKRITESREIDEYEPNSVMLFMLAQT